jgi:hypothetical protein
MPAFHEHCGRAADEIAARRSSDIIAEAVDTCLATWRSEGWASGRLADGSTESLGCLAYSQMHVVGHQAARPDADLTPFCLLRQQLKIYAGIFVAEECPYPPVPR